MGTTTTTKSSTTEEVAWITGAAKDEILLGAGTSIATLDVLGNDPGSAVLYGVYTALNPSQDASTSTSLPASLMAVTTLGGVVRIVDGKVAYTPPGSGPGAAALGALHAGETITDSFQYVIWMAQKGAYSLATTTVVLAGADDPAMIGGDTSGTVKDNVTPHASGLLTIVDPDRGEAGFQADSVDGAYGVFQLQADGAWTYDLDNARADPLAEGEKVLETFTVKAIDGTTQDITVTVIGSNDAAVIQGDATGSVTEDSSTTTTGGKLTVIDPDPDQAAMTAATLAGAYGVLRMAEDGTWDYALDAGLANPLAQGAQVVDSFTVSSADGGTQQVIDVTVTGSNDGPTAGADAAGTDESTPIVIDVLANDTDPDSTALVVASVGTQFPGTSVSVGEDGKVRFDPGTAFEHLPEGAQATVTLDYSVQDDHGAQAASTVTVTIQGVNDPATFSGTMTGQVTEDTLLTTGGVLAVQDVDDGEAQLNGSSTLAGAYGDFHIDLGNGQWNYTLRNADARVQQLSAGATATDHLDVVSADGSTATLRVDIVGTNDKPVANPDSASTQENQAITINVLANDTDPDSTTALSIARVRTFTEGTSLSVNGDGSLLFDPGTAYDHLPAGAQSIATLVYVVQDDHGAQAASTVLVTMQGVNDPASFEGSTTTGQVTEDTLLSTGGVLKVKDVDDDEARLTRHSNLAGTYGDFAIDLDTGGWSYTLHNDDPAVQQLATGSTVTEFLDVWSAEGAKATLRVAIAGADEQDHPATFWGDFAGTVKENVATQASGWLHVDDADADQSLMHVATLQGAFGKLSMQEDGHWTYALDSAKADPLGEGMMQNDLFTVHSIDGTPQEIGIMVFGTNDPATIDAGNSLYQVFEDGMVQLASGRFIVSDADGAQSSLGGSIHQTGVYGQFGIDQSSGSWTYRLSNSSAAVQGLDAGEEGYDTLMVSSIDGTASAAVTVHIVGAAEPTLGGTSGDGSGDGMR